MSSLTSGDTLDSRFTLVRSLGRGGMGDVWLVRDEELGEEVVAKILPREADETRVTLLRRECSHARRLVHPNIVRVFEFHRSDRGAFVTMAYVEGEDLRSWRGRREQALIRGILPIVDALRHAHGLGVVHRDLKPHNIVSDASGVPHLLDFGIAGMATPGEDLRGGGSRAYVSPQQLRGDAPSPADDIYGLGALLSDLLTGRPPAPGEAPIEWQSEGLAGLVAKLLADDPADRPQDMRAVEGELRALLDEQRERDPLEARAAVVAPPRAQPIRPVRPELRSKEVREDRRFPRPGLVGTLVLLVVAIALALFVLPQWLPERSPPELSDPLTKRAAPDAPEPPQSDSSKAGDRPDLRERAKRKRQAERAQSEAQALLVELEGQDVMVWAGEQHAAVLAQLSIADQRLSEREYAEAESSYNRASSTLTGLVERSLGVLEEALDNGREALEAGDSIAAAESYGVALAIDPSHDEARIGLERAAVLDRVIETLESGRLAEREGELGVAEQHYAEGLRLDPRSTDSRSSLDRVRTAIRSDRFGDAMTEALEALERAEYAEARAAFERAKSIRPEASELAAGVARLDATERLASILRRRELAEALEEKEEWVAAQKEYARVLELDPTIVFAQRGAARCGERAALAGRIDFHLDNPDRLTEDEVLVEAEIVLEQARQIAPAGPQHRAQLAHLEELLRTASTFVSVRLESDLMTDVTVYRVGRLGTFESHDLRLRPGRYTVVGSRGGYRDVRRELVVVAGGEPAPLVVRCEDPI